MHLLVGLGNPGGRYAGNRHNIGFMALDRLAQRHGFGPWRARFEGECAEGRIGSHKVLALKPKTFMNLSGRSVGAAVRFFKLEPAQVLVCHDEIELAPGKVRVKVGGGNAGHNGLKDIDGHLGRDYRRLRLGVGRPADKSQVTNWVLSDFAKAERDWLDPLLDAVADHMGRLLDGDEAQFLNALAGLGPARPEKPPRPDKPTAAPTAGALTPGAPTPPPAASGPAEKSSEGPMAEALKRLFK
ncbi:aminoacyl-tRNA hydrolase [Roseospirillum parvum]|uniref:Peptidyl-tRNA hydrolase n=1 Tax=Roseospirillum parvum TaxID=83401 RepID=A0A1G7ZG11_9PROT|nr:aminoacyl-tRNA hydrolase [Roseospirillum parvum]SDH07466.1 peptidyl-tRNA hydrolase, PTH1 family [Roseospirillum parvum]